MRRRDPMRTGTWCGVVLVALLVVACGPAEVPPGFVRMEQGALVLDGKPWFPLVMNTNVGLMTDGERAWPASYAGYEPGDRPRFTDPDSCRQLLRAEFALIRSMGFHAVRIVALAERPRKQPGEKAYGVLMRTPAGTHEEWTLDRPEVWPRYLDAVREVVRLCDQEGLKVILLTTIHPGERDSEVHFARLADHLRHEPGILAFDLFNEPLYFEIPARTKREAVAITRHWRELARRHAPHHLITIGLTGIRETHAWDPNILDVDFLSFHPYEYEPDQVLNEIRWYGTHVRTPWMIGETSLPADGDSVSYSEQGRFAERTLAQTRACGGIGYSWWQFKDVRWGRFHSDFMGLMTRDTTETGVDGHPITVTGTVKPTVEVFRGFDPQAAMSACEELPNYLNYSQHRTARITGRLVDDAGRSIEGGVFLAWNEHFSHSYHTTTRADGRFELYGDMYFHHWIVSAVDHTMVRDECDPAAYLTGGDGIPTLFLGDLVIAPMGRGILR